MKISLSFVLITLAASCYSDTCEVDDPRSLFLCGERAFQAGTHREAWEYYKQAWNVEEDSPSARSVRGSSVLNSMWRLTETNPEYSEWFVEKLRQAENLVVSADASLDDVMDWSALSRVMGVDNADYVSEVLARTYDTNTRLQISLAKWNALSEAGQYDLAADATTTKADIFERELIALQSNPQVTSEFFTAYVLEQQSEWSLLSKALTEIGLADQVVRIERMIETGVK